MLPPVRDAIVSTAPGPRRLVAGLRKRDYDSDTRSAIIGLPHSATGNRVDRQKSKVCAAAGVAQW